MKLKILTALLIVAFQMVHAQDWIQLNDLPETFLHRHHPVAFSLNGYGYILTGDVFIDEAKDFFKYDPLSDTWEQLDDFPGKKRSFAYGVTTQDRAYVGFGSYTEVINGTPMQLNDWWVYDQVTNEWTELTSCPYLARSHPAMIALNDKIFVGLGGGGPQTGPSGEDFGGDMNDWWEYDIQSDTWTQKPDFPGIWRHHPFYFGIDGIAYVDMGHHHSNIEMVGYIMIYINTILHLKHGCKWLPYQLKAEWRVHNSLMMAKGMYLVAREKHIKTCRQASYGSMIRFLILGKNCLLTQV